MDDHGTELYLTGAATRVRLRISLRSRRRDVDPLLAGKSPRQAHHFGLTERPSPGIEHHVLAHADECKQRADLVEVSAMVREFVAEVLTGHKSR